MSIHRIAKVYTVQRREFLLTATVTRVEVADPDPALAGIDLRQTRAFLQSEALPLRPRLHSAVTAAVGLLRAELLTLPRRRRVIVLGRKLPRAFSEVSGAASDLPAELAGLRDQLATVDSQSEVTVRLWLGDQGERQPDVKERMPASKLQEMLAAVTAQARSGRSTVLAGAGGPGLAQALGTPRLWSSGRQVRVHIEVAGELAGLTLQAGVLAAALAEPESLGAPGDEHPVYTVSLPQPGTLSPLVLDASTLQIHGNVVAATEGVTVAGEVLGDGDAAQENQTFPLAQPPAFVRGDGGEWESTLSVSVQHKDQIWEKVPSLHQWSGESRVYRTDLDSLGRAVLVFGDGTNGARLPTGQGNVVASYRTGMSARPVVAGGLSLLVNRPLGLDAVSNLLRSTPGAPPEGRDEIRRKAPRTVRTLGRIVSLQDYEDFALDFSGVEKAGAWGLIAGGSPAVQITLAAADGDPIPEGGGLIVQLLGAIHRSRAEQTPVYVQSYRPVRVLVEAGIQVAPGFLWDDVRQAVLAAVAEDFGFARSRFGGSGSISAAAVVSSMQRVRGVQAVDLDRFSWAGREEGGEEPRERRAAPPSWDPVSGELLAAELVLLDPPLLRETGR